MDQIVKDIKYYEAEIRDLLEVSIYDNIYSDDLLVQTINKIDSQYNLLINKVDMLIKLTEFINHENRLYKTLYKNMGLDPVEEIKGVPITDNATGEVVDSNEYIRKQRKLK